MELYFQINQLANFWRLSHLKCIPIKEIHIFFIIVLIDKFLFQSVKYFFVSTRVEGRGGILPRGFAQIKACVYTEMSLQFYIVH